MSFDFWRLSELLLQAFELNLASRYRQSHLRKLLKTEG